MSEGWRSCRELPQCGERDWVRFDDLITTRTTEAARSFSSGTTGLPKAAMLTHYKLLRSMLLDVIGAPGHGW